MAISKIKIWIKAFRLRTLPLSFSGILLGNLLAYANKALNNKVLILSFITAFFLQILSNLANDYGDAVKGTDNDDRIGPERAIQSGEISLKSMKTAIIIFVILSFISGVWLILEGVGNISYTTFFVFLVLGIAAIIAAVKYTAGKKPYGYYGFGDLFVFIFFGITGVMGTYYLHVHRADLDILLPASSIGFLCAGVLNINNMRDRKQDGMHGKKTISVLLGEKKSKIYHTILLSSAIISGITYTCIYYNSPYQWMFLFAVPLIIRNLILIWKNTVPAKLDPLLKDIVIITMIFSITFGFGLIL